MATDWSDEAKARRSAAAKKAAATRKANVKKAEEHWARLKAETAAALAEEKRVAERGAEGMNNAVAYPYIQNSRVARWALSGGSTLAMMRSAPRRV
jgi:hypothetical protein